MPGDAAESYLIEMVTTDDAEVRMPKDKPPLSEADGENAARVDRRRAAVGSRASRSRPHDYEPPLRPRRPELPPAVDGRTNPIDRILDAYLAGARRCAAGAAR